MTRTQPEAFVDESESHHGPGLNTYMLAASICESSSIDDVRSAMSALLLRGQRKLHWHDESGPRRRAIAETIAELPLDHLIVIRTGRPGERSERRRRLCLHRLMFELEAGGVAMAIFESRGTADDRRDRGMVDSLRSQKVIDARVRISHVKGPLDPMLWVPDAVCGAISASRSGDRLLLTIVERHRPAKVVVLPT